MNKKISNVSLLIILSILYIIGVKLKSIIFSIFALLLIIIFIINEKKIKNK